MLNFNTIDGNFLYDQYKKDTAIRDLVCQDLSPYINETQIKDRFETTKILIQNLLKQVYHQASIQANTAIGNSCVMIDAEKDHPDWNITKVFLEKVFYIKCNSIQSLGVNGQKDRFSYGLSWKACNPLSNFKPVLKFTKNHKMTMDFFSSLFLNPYLADFTICVENEKFAVHKVILAQCSFFAERLKHNQTYACKDCDKNTFLAFLAYLYKRDINGKFYTSVQNCLNMLHFAESRDYLPLINVAKAHIFKQINNEFFLEVALQLEDFFDSDLDELCNWFARVQDPSLWSDLDLSLMKISKLKKVLQIAGKYNVEPLLDKASKAIRNKMENICHNLNLDADFIDLCITAVADKDMSIKNTVLVGLKNQKGLFDKMIAGKKAEYRNHWKAYKRLISTSDLL